MLIRLQLKKDIAELVPFIVDWKLIWSVCLSVHSCTDPPLHPPTPTPSGLIIAHTREQRAVLHYRGNCTMPINKLLSLLTDFLLSIFNCVTYIDRAGRHIRPGRHVTDFQDSLQPHPFGDGMTVFSFDSTSDRYARLGTYTRVDILTIFQSEHFNLM